MPTRDTLRVPLAMLCGGGAITESFEFMALYVHCNIWAAGTCVAVCVYACVGGRVCLGVCVYACVWVYIYDYIGVYVYLACGCICVFGCL